MFLAVAVALLAAVAIAVVLLWNCNRLPDAATKVELIRIGMHKGEISLLLGAPRKRSENDRLWVYQRPFAWPALRLTFDDDGLLESYHEDY
jgi:hypothetical protein